MACIDVEQTAQRPAGWKKRCVVLGLLLNADIVTICLDFRSCRLPRLLILTAAADSCLPLLPLLLASAAVPLLFCRRRWTPS